MIVVQMLTGMSHRNTHEYEVISHSLSETSVNQVLGDFSCHIYFQLIKKIKILIH